MSSAEWCVEGVAPGAAAAWVRAGFTPASSAEWRVEGVAPGAVAAWVRAGFTPASSAEWCVEGVAPGAAAAWIRAGFTTASRDWSEWHASGWDPQEARIRRGRGLSPDIRNRLLEFDLHGYLVATALDVIDALLRDCSAIGWCKIMFNTGRGKNNPGGLSAIKEAVVEKYRRGAYPDWDVYEGPWYLLFDLAEYVFAPDGRESWSALPYPEFGPLSPPMERRLSEWNGLRAGARNPVG